MKILKFTLLFFLVLLIFELVIRSIDPISKLQGYDKKIFTKNKKFGYKYGKQGSYKWRGKSFTINKYGYRGG